jgi:dihydroxy-acid dehydratase
MTTDPNTQPLRSQRWFAPDDLRSFGHRSRLKGMGWSDEDYRDKPVIAILNTWSDLNTCHSHLRERAEEIKRGVWQAGGFPVEIPVLSLSEMLMKPTTMLYRNLLAMETEEVLRSHPVDGAILMGGCDKTTPGLIMGAISMDLPMVYFPCGPMLTARWRDQTLGSGSDAWKYWTERCAGNFCDEHWNELENCIARSPGHCMTMGTASTMTAIAESLGLTLSGASSIPAVVSDHHRLATATGRHAVELVRKNIRPSSILTRESFENAITVDMAIGGSTNCIIHVLAMARRAKIDITLDDFDRISRQTPVIANIRPAGKKYLMEDFFNAGGLRALMNELRPYLHTHCATIEMKSLGECLDGAEIIDEDVIRKLSQPLSQEGGTYVLRGNLAPDGCVIKPIAAEPRLMHHRGPAIVFDSYDELKKAVVDPDLDITADHVMILRNAGPQGAPGFPEWGMLPIPNKLLKQGIRDMVRISDARMSGTSYGTCILHVAPESYIGGPLALVRNGDLIELNVPERSLQLLVSEAELAQRRSAWQAPAPRYQRGYGQLFIQHVRQANEGCDFDFLESGPSTPEPSIH